jgi:hypothetical protein
MWIASAMGVFVFGLVMARVDGAVEHIAAQQADDFGGMMLVFGVRRVLFGMLTGCNTEDFDAIRDDDDLCLAASRLDQIGKEGFITRADSQQEIDFREAGGIRYGWLEGVHVGSAWDERLDRQAVTGDVLRDIGEDGGRGKDSGRIGLRLGETNTQHHK